MSIPENKILADDARQSQNFFTSDLILNNYLRKHCKSDAFFYINEKLEDLGEEAAIYMDKLSLTADKNPPELKRRTPYGETVNEVDFHIAYRELLDIAARSEMFYVKYSPALRGRFNGDKNKMSFAAGQLYAMAELGVYCPLCMTDGAALLLEKYGDDDDRSRLIPHLSSRNGNDLYTGAMFITEKSGGSDVGANLTRAELSTDNHYRLNGEKWFCSNVNADVIMTLARTGAVEEGTRGLSLFKVEKFLSNLERNPMDIIRLKEKMGVRSMATGEVRFTDTIGKRIGEEGEGFKLMTEMINISRLYNSVAALAGMRRAIVEAYQYLNHRITFGKKAIEHPLVREKFHELGTRYVGNFYMVWRTIEALDYAEIGDEEEKELLRILIPLTKWWTAEQGVYIVRECMELMGGNGYIEDFIMPKLFRDINVLPIWEGTGNIIILDVLRATKKSKGLNKIIQTIGDAMDTVDPYGSILDRELGDVLSNWELLNKEKDREIIEVAAKPIFGDFIKLFQMSLMLQTWDDSSSRWISPALSYMVSELHERSHFNKPISVEQVDRLISWEY